MDGEKKPIMQMALQAESRVVPANGILTYRPDGLRATKSVDSVLTRQYLYDGQSLVAEKDGSDILKVSYTNGLNEVISRTEHDGETADTIFFLYDANLNVNAIVDEDGELLKTFDYEEFGGPHPASVAETKYTNTNAENNKLQFAGGVGHLTDDSGLIYMRARYYDPASGRFISEDPGRNGSNWYAYCGYNPVNMVDPTGQMGLMSTIVTSDLIGYLCYVVAAAFVAWIWYEAVEGNLGNPHGGHSTLPSRRNRCLYGLPDKHTKRRKSIWGLRS
ncbi:MAG TPA: RHS repeat-associated core domain-containing protein [Armatimonadota bacterium]|nr:RHS repeat-associated core domain-containing protein [Armatimonadota bacterium]